MQLHTFRAANLSEALSVVREELGAQATVLRTREVQKRLLGVLPGRRCIEVTATASDEEVLIQQTLTGTAEEEHYSVEEDAGTHYASYEQASSDDTQYASYEQASDADPTPNWLESVAQDYAVMDDDAEDDVHYSVQTDFRRSNAAQDDLQQMLMQDLDELTGMVDNLQEDTWKNELHNTDFEKVEDVADLERLNDLEEMEEDVAEPLLHLFADLLESEVPEDFARDLITEVEQLAGEKVEHWETTRRLLSEVLESKVEVTNGIMCREGTCRSAAIVGATGIGKTTTLLKLATHFRVEKNLRVGLITADTAPLAGTSQFCEVAETLDLPVQAVTTAEQMRDAVAKWDWMDLVLIDTPGINPRDTENVEQIHQMLEAAEIDEVHLALSLATSPRTLWKTAEAFVPMGLTACLLTKFDEVNHYGVALRLLGETDLPVSYIACGQQISGDLRVAEAKEIASFPKNH